MHNKPLSIYVLRDHIRSVENAFAEAYSLIGFSNGSLRNLFPGIFFIIISINQVSHLNSVGIKGRIHFPLCIKKLFVEHVSAKNY